jgi:hypothetical protein
MLKHVLYASAALALLAAPCIAADTTVTINGTVEAACSITNGTPVIDLTDALATDAAGKHPGQTFDLEDLVGSAWCNGSDNTLTAVAKPLIGDHTAAGFTNVISYTLSTPVVPGEILNSGTDPAGNSASASGVGAFVLDVTAGEGTLVTDATSLPVTAGDYSAEIEITLTPGV